MVLKAKSNFNADLGPATVPPRYGSHLWRSLMKVWDKTVQGIQWVIRDGAKVRFWLDKWVDDGDPLIHMALGTVPLCQRERVVQDSITEDGNWCWHEFQHFLPHQILLSMLKS